MYHYWRYARCWWHLTLHIINVEKNISRLLFRCQYKFCDLWSSIICIDLKLQIQVSFTSHWIQTRSSDKPEVNVTLNSSAVLDPKQMEKANLNTKAYGRAENRNVRNIRQPVYGCSILSYSNVRLRQIKRFGRVQTQLFGFCVILYRPSFNLFLKLLLKEKMHLGDLVVLGGTSGLNWIIFFCNYTIFLEF